MYSIIVMSHGDMANGLKDTMMMILGEQEDIYFISFTPSDSIEDFRKRVNVIYHSIEEDRQVLFLTDLYGGTPNHVATAMKIAEPGRVEVLSGVNMPLLMEATLGKAKVLSDIVEHLLEQGRGGMIRIEPALDQNEEDE
ncbi:hypothetical protein GSF08_10630 [Clostridiaceae bacterium DONG20-135]|uniref:PTS EIIA type-4 domain-containing protein n=1 Tax=Copranaerobaculum intestinale TaxID=2692629 RepID=A0A6N8UD74_9FIRM|nr:PTS sugar transporter subunit IIA [Copranaerobaculum intestinale]MXQ74379.1 hypothetical protein [Copranaerobaculum intestinale]